MGRELRKVPANWQHPKMSNGNHQPLFNEYYKDALDEWLKNHNAWIDGTHPDLLEDPALKEKYPFYAMWDNNPPDIEYYHHVKYKPEDLTHIQLYETTSEGTPVSPVFPASDIEKLCEWAAENCTTFADFKASKEQWLKMLKDGMLSHQHGNVMFI